MKIKSPDEFERAYRELELRLSNSLAKNTHWLGNAVAALGVIAVVYFSNLWLDGFRYTLIGGFSLMETIQYGIHLSVLLSLVMVFYKPTASPIMQFFLLASVWSGSATFLFSKISGMFSHLLILSFIPAVCLLGFWCITFAKTQKKKWTSAFLLSAFYWSGAGVLSYLAYTTDYELLLTFWRLKTQFIWLFILIFIFKSEGSIDKAVLAFNPANALHGTLWPDEFRTSARDSFEKRRLWWQGILNILLGYLLFLFRIWLEREHMGTSLLSKSAGQYFLILIGDVAIFNILVGVARTFGYQVRDATNFVFLAKTPAEQWKRGSVYNYIFIFRHIYLPLIAVIKNRFIVTFVAFTVFFINHFGFWNFLKITLNKFGQLFPIHYIGDSVIHLRLSYFFVWFFLVYFSRRYWFISAIQRENPYLAWCSIFLTNLVYIICGFVTEYAYYHH